MTLLCWGCLLVINIISTRRPIQVWFNIVILASDYLLADLLLVIFPFTLVQSPYSQIFCYFTGFGSQYSTGLFKWLYSVVSTPQGLSLITVFGSQYSTGFIFSNCIRESILHRTLSSITIFRSQCSSGLLLNNLLGQHSSGLLRVISAGSVLLWASPCNFCWISSPLGFSSITCWIALLWASPGNLATWQLGNLAIWIWESALPRISPLQLDRTPLGVSGQFGNLAIWLFGNLDLGISTP